MSALNGQRRKYRDPGLSESDQDKLAKAASDDLRDPIRKIAAYVDLLEDALADDDRAAVEESLDGIQSSAGKARQLVLDLLNYYRIAEHDLNVEDVDLDSAARRAAEMCRQKVAGLGGRVLIDTDGLTLRADGALLQQVLQNLIGSALDHVHPGRRPEVVIHARQVAEGVELSVKHNGEEPSRGAPAPIPEPAMHGHPPIDCGVSQAAVCLAASAMGWSVRRAKDGGRGSAFTVLAPGTWSKGRTHAESTV